MDFKVLTYYNLVVFLLTNDIIFSGVLPVSLNVEVSNIRSSEVELNSLFILFVDPKKNGEWSYEYVNILTTAFGVKEDETQKLGKGPSISTTGSTVTLTNKFRVVCEHPWSRPRNTFGTYSVNTFYSTRFESVFPLTPPTFCGLDLLSVWGSQSPSVPRDEPPEVWSSGPSDSCLSTRLRFKIGFRLKSYRHSPCPQYVLLVSDPTPFVLQTAPLVPILSLDQSVVDPNLVAKVLRPPIDGPLDTGQELFDPRVEPSRWSSGKRDPEFLQVWWYRYLDLKGIGERGRDDAGEPQTASGVPLLLSTCPNVTPR